VTRRGAARLAVLISGRGSNLQAFIDACSSGELDARICVVVSNRPDAQGLERAAAAGIPSRCIDHRNYPSREAFDRALAAEVGSWQPDLVILAGFMRILTPAFVQPFAGRLLNVHPSLLPKYPGLDTHQRALDAGDSEAGVTVHFVTLELDGGPPIIRARVPILTGDTAQALAARVIEREHIIYPLAARWFISGRLQLTDEGAFLDGEPIPATGIDYPGPEN
jgi:phosphoribosylglycinamide formyltransferase-1